MEQVQSTTRAEHCAVCPVMTQGHPIAIYSHRILNRFVLCSSQVKTAKAEASHEYQVKKKRQQQQQVMIRDSCMLHCRHCGLSCRMLCPHVPATLG